MWMKYRILVAVLIGGSIAGCQKQDGTDQKFPGIGPRPDILPVMLNKDLPFRYPPSLYAKKVQANVLLRVYIDKEGQIVSESTHVAESSGYPPLDSSAVKGSTELRFIPAKRAENQFLFRFFFRFISGIRKHRLFRETLS